MYFARLIEKGRPLTGTLYLYVLASSTWSNAEPKNDIEE